MEKQNTTKEKDDISFLIKKLLKAIYINDFIKDKDIEAKIEKLKKITKPELTKIIEQIIKNDIIRKIINEKNSNEIIKKIKTEIQNINKKYKFRLEEIINEEKINEEELENAIKLTKSINDFYNYQDEKKQKQELDTEIKTIDELIKIERYLNIKFEQSLSLIAEEIEYIKSLKKPKIYQITQNITYKKNINMHKQTLKEEIKKVIKYIKENNETIKNKILKYSYFQYDTITQDLINDFEAYLKEDKYIKIFSELENIYESSKKDIENAKKAKIKKQKQYETIKIKENAFFENIIKNLKTKQNKYIFYIVNNLYRFKENEQKQELFKLLLKALKIINSIENNIYPNIEECEIIDYEIIFLKTILSDDINEKTIENNIELYKKIIKIYMNEEKINIKKK